MAISLQMIAGAETCVLSGTTLLLESFAQETPEVGAESVTNSIELTLVGTVDATIAKIEKFLQRARARLAGAYGTDIVYLELTIDSAVWRSPVFDGKLVIPGDTWLKYEKALGTRKATLIVTRAAWWEDSTLRDATLLNENGTTTAGLNVYNCDDMSGTAPNKRDSSITLGTVLGDLPAPAHIELLVASAAGLNDVMITQKIVPPLSPLGSHWDVFEAVGLPFTIGSAAASGGFYQQSNAGPGTAVPLVNSSTVAAGIRGGYCRILARMGFSGAGTVTVTPFSNDASTLAWGKKITLQPSAAGMWWWDLGVVQIPLNFIRASGASAGYAYIEFGWSTVLPAGIAMDVDCGIVAALDGWKRVSMPVVLATGETLIIDETYDDIFGVNGAGAIFSYGTALGAPLMLYPGESQQFRLAWNTATLPYSASGADITAYVTAKIKYRPRRRTL